MTLGIYELLGKLAVLDGSAKLIVLDKALRREARRLVIAANQENQSYVNEEEQNTWSNRNRVFLLDDALDSDGELLPSNDIDRPLLTAGFLSLLEPHNQGNLVNFRDGSVCLSFRSLDDGSNDENAFPIWLDNEIPDSRSITYELLASLYLQNLNENINNSGFEQDFNDGIRRISAAMKYVADAYRDLGRTERVSTGSLWLQHMDLAIRRFSQLVLSSDDLSVPDLLDLVNTFFFPAVSLPNPHSGDTYQTSQRLGAAKSVAGAIQKFWCEADGTNRIIDSIENIDEQRLFSSGPKDASLLSQIDWGTIRQSWIGQGLSSSFLSWHIHEVANGGNPGSSSRFEIFLDLTEEEFFSPLPLLPSLIQGEWTDGREMRYEDLGTDIVILSPTFFDVGTRQMSSSKIQLRIVPLTSQELSKDELGEIQIIPKRVRRGGSNLEFNVDEVRVDTGSREVILEGVFTQSISGRDKFSFSPEVLAFKAVGSTIRSGQEMRVILLPPAGSGFLVGKNTKYYGPKRFDKNGLPIWDVDDIDEESDTYEFAIERNAGDQVLVIAWSSLIPDHVSLDGNESRPWTDRGFIRWSENFPARPDEQEVDGYWGELR
jgi:hypothetical protein